MTNTIRFNFLKPTAWPDWVHDMVDNQEMMEDWLSTGQARYRSNTKTSLYDRVAEFNKAKSYYPLDLEVIDNSVWVVVSMTPEVTMAILNSP